MTDRPAPDERLRDAVHAEGTHDPRLETRLLQGILKRQTVHHRGQHADVVSADPFDAEIRGVDAPKDIPTTDHDAELHTGLVGVADLLRDLAGHLVIDTVGVAAHEGLTRKLQENPSKAKLSRIGHVALSRRNGQSPADAAAATVWSASPMAKRAKRPTTMFSPRVVIASVSRSPTVLSWSFTKLCSSRTTSDR